MNIANLFYRRPRLLVLTLALIVVAGLSALQILPRSEDPELTNRWATIFTYYPGANAKQVESLVTEKIEDEMREIEEIDVMHSGSRADMSSVVIELSDEVGPDETDAVWSRVRDRLADIEKEFPEGVQKSVFEEFSNTAWTMLLGLTWDLPGEPNVAILGRLADELKSELWAVTGTEKVRVYGEPEEEITVEVDPARLAAYGIRVEDVMQAVRRNDSKIPAGQVRGDRNKLLIEVSGELDSLDRVRNLAIRAGASGRFLRLGDVGTVRKGRKLPAESMALVGGEDGVVVASRMMTSKRIDLWRKDTRAVIASFEERLPRGVVLTTLFDQGRYTESRLSTLFGNFMAAAGLVMLVILFTMGWRSAIAVGAALPLTSLMVLTGMNAFGIPIHQMSITGLIIALGLLIDNAIVMVDEVRQRLERGRRVREAIGRSVQHLFVPLLGSTVTTVFAFMPIMLMPGPAGEFVGGIAKTVVLALLSSFFLGMTVVPTLSGLLSGRFGGGASGTSWLQRGLSNARVTALYRRGLMVLTGRPLLSLGIAMLLPVLGFLAFSRLEEQFFPPADRDQAAIEIRLPWHTSIAKTREDALAAREEMRKHPLVEDVHWFLGESAPKFYYNFIESLRGVDFYAQGLVQFKQSEGSFAAIRELQRRLDRRFPEAQMLTTQLEQGPPFAAPIELRVFGDDIGVLREIGEQLRQVLSTIPGVTHTRATMEGGQPKLMVALDEEKARLVGFDNTTVANHLQGSLEGREGGSMIEGTEELPVRVRVRNSDRAVVATVGGLDLPNRDGWTPLAAVSDLVLVPNTAAIPHRDGRRANTVQAFLEAGLLPNRVLTEFRRRLDAVEFELPQGFELELGGEAAERDEAVTKLAATAVILMVLMGASLVLSFNSFRLAGIIAGVGLLSVGLSMLALFAFGYPFGFMAIVGTMGLIGVAVNDSIVVLAALRENTAARAGDRAAVVETVIRATRHLVSTSLTTMAGFTPLLLAGGGFWPPVAVAIGGGVAGATLLAVTFVPTLFQRWARRNPLPAGEAVQVV